MKMTVSCPACGEETHDVPDTGWIYPVTATAGFAAEQQHEKDHHFNDMVKRMRDPNTQTIPITSRPAEFGHGKEHNA